MNDPRRNSRAIPDARPLLSKASFFLGTLRDGLPMINLQAVYLVSACGYTEKQVGILFLTFGLAQTVCMVPAGYLLDYSGKHKVQQMVVAVLTVSTLTVVTTSLAAMEATNLPLQIILHALQGGASAILPPAFNGITLGITGQTQFTSICSRNRSMNHLGTAALIVISCITAYYSYPNFQILFAAAPVAATAAVYFLLQIPSNAVYKDAASGLVRESPTMTEYLIADDLAACKIAAMEIVQDNGDGTQRRRGSMTSDGTSYQPPRVVDGSQKSIASDSSSNSSTLSFQCGWDNRTNYDILKENTKDASDDNTASVKPQAHSPAQVLSDPIVQIFGVAIFFFHLANSAVLPLVMQSLALQDPVTGILLSGLCIFIAQACMAFIAQCSGDKSAEIGRKPLVVVGLASLTLRCFLLTVLVSAEDWFVGYFADATWEEKGATTLKALILSTQLLDSVGAGILGTLQILVTSDIAGGSGRFSFVLGGTAGSMCLGATVSGYLGQAIAQDYGYEIAFTVLGVISIVPLVLYVVWMPETLPDFIPSQRRRKQRIQECILGKHTKVDANIAMGTSPVQNDNGRTLELV